MSKDKQSRISTKSSSTKKKEEAARLKKRKDESSDSDFIDDEDDESIDEEIDMQEYREFLAKTFPSKHLDKKVKAGNKLKEVLEDESDEDNKEKRSKSLKKNTPRKKKIVEEESEEDDDEEYIPPKKSNKKAIKSPKKRPNYNRPNKIKSRFKQRRAKYCSWRSKKKSSCFHN